MSWSVDPLSLWRSTGIGKGEGKAADIEEKIVSSTDHNDGEKVPDFFAKRREDARRRHATSPPPPQESGDESLKEGDTLAKRRQIENPPERISTAVTSRSTPDVRNGKGRVAGDQASDEEAQRRLTTPATSVSPESRERMPGVFPATPLDTATRQVLESSNPVVVELRVKLRLFPAMLLLSHHRGLGAGEIHEARDHAHEAFKLANAASIMEGNAALVGRCAFYVGLAEYLHFTRDQAGISPTTLKAAKKTTPRTPGSTRHVREACLRWFEQALDAGHVYVEAEWAEEWIEFIGNEMMAEESSPDWPVRPESAGSWTFWRNWILGSDSKQQREYPSGGGGRESLERRWKVPPGQLLQEGNRVPTFSTWSSGKEDGDQRPLPNNALGGNINIKDIKATPSRASSSRLELDYGMTGAIGTANGLAVTPSSATRQQQQQPSPPRRRYRIANPDPSSPTEKSSAATSAPASIQSHPPDLLPSPTTTSSSSRRHTRAKTIAFSPAIAKTPGGKDSSSSPTWKSIYDRPRKPSIVSPLMALAAIREKRPSEASLMEEGQSPLQATFASGSDGDVSGVEWPGRLTQRKGSKEDAEEML